MIAVAAAESAVINERELGCHYLDAESHETVRFDFEIRGAIGGFASHGPECCDECYAVFDDLASDSAIDDSQYGVVTDYRRHYAVTDVLEHAAVFGIFEYCAARCPAANDYSDHGCAPADVAHARPVQCVIERCSDAVRYASQDGCYALVH